MTDGTADLLVRAAIEALPNVVSGIKAVFARTNPDAAPPSDADVIAALNGAYSRSLAKDDAWLAAHPAADDQAPPTI